MIRKKLTGMLMISLAGGLGIGIGQSRVQDRVWAAHCEAERETEPGTEERPEAEPEEEAEPETEERPEAGNEEGPETEEGPGEEGPETEEVTEEEPGTEEVTEEESETEEESGEEEVTEEEPETEEVTEEEAETEEVTEEESETEEEPGKEEVTEEEPETEEVTEKEPETEEGSESEEAPREEPEAGAVSVPENETEEHLPRLSVPPARMLLRGRFLPAPNTVTSVYEREENWTSDTAAASDARTDTEVKPDPPETVKDSKGIFLEQSRSGGSPALEITGVSTDYDQDGTMSVLVSLAKEQIDEDTIRIEVYGMDAQEQPEIDHITYSEDKAKICFKEGSEEALADGNYLITITAGQEDEIKKQTAEFTVNRKGSVYSVEELTREQLGTYYHRDAFPIILEEVNPELVEHSEILLLKDGKSRCLEEGTDYLKEGAASDDGKTHYSYRIREDVFRQDGAYQIMLKSIDSAQHQRDTVSAGTYVRFAVDRTKPECMVNGIEDGMVIEAQQKWISIELRDNMKLGKAQVLLNGNPVETESTDDEDMRRRIIKLRLTSEENWQTLQVRASDAAGNEYLSPEIRFLLAKDADRGEAGKKGRPWLPGSAAALPVLLTIGKFVRRKKAW